MRKIVSTPTKLESTSQVVVFGTDVFAVRVSPDTQFDVLKEDFNKLYLFLALAGMALGCVLANWYMQRGEKQKLVYGN